MPDYETRRVPSLRAGAQRRGVVSIVLAAALGSAACSGLSLSDGHEALTLVTSKPVVYVCANGERIVARYYRLSDNSLHFVKLFMPGDKQHTLPNAVSASGARYTDDRELVWWSRGNTAFVEARDSDGKWYVQSTDCRHIDDDN